MRVLVFHEDWGDPIYNVDTDEKLYDVALRVLTARCKNTNYYGQNESRNRAETIIILGSGKLAWDFLQERDQDSIQWECMTLTDVIE